MLTVATADEDRLCGCLCLLRLFLTMDEIGEGVCESLLCLIEVCALPLRHLLDLLDRDKGEQLQALDDIGVIDVSPVLVELIRCSLICVEPYRTTRGLAHLLAFLVGQQGDGQRIGILALLLTDQLRTGQHIGPLIIATELHIAAVVLIQTVEVIALHQHVGKLQEGQALLHTIGIAACTQHIIDRKARSDLTHEIQEVQITQPVGVIDHLGLARSELDETAHLLLEALTVMIDLLDGHHLTHIGTTGRVTDHTGTTADQGDRLIAGLLQTLHQGQCHKVTYMQRICRRVKADIEGRLPVIDQITNLLLIGNLRNQSSGYQLLINTHFTCSL